MTTSAILLRSSSPVPLFFWCFLGLGVGIYMFVQGFRLLQRRRLILDTPASKIRSASMGMVELNGLAVGPYTMVAPITTRPCYCYRTFVWEWKQSGKNKQWVKVASECMHVPFFLDDNTGKVLVDPRGADLDLHRDFQQEFCDSFFTTKQEAPPNVHAFLSRHGINTTNKIKVEEFCVKPKNALFMLGTLDENLGLEVTSQPIHDAETSPLIVGNALSFSVDRGAVRSALSPVIANAFSMSGGLQHDPKFDEIYEKAIPKASAQVIRLSPNPSSTKTADMTQQQKIAAALTKAGITTPAAWATAHVAPAAGVTPAATTDAFDPRPAVVLMKGKNNPTFLISWRSQREVARSLGWKCTLMIWGGPVLTLLSLYLLLAATHSL